MIYLDLDDLLHIAARTLGHQPDIRDVGLLESALARPRSSAFGEDAYADLETKAAALLHSLARNHGLVDGNKRLALVALISLLGLNGRRLTWSNDEAHDFVVRVSSGRLDSVDAIADGVRDATETW